MKNAIWWIQGQPETSTPCASLNGSVLSPGENRAGKAETMQMLKVAGSIEHVTRYRWRSSHYKEYIYI